jgi:hypothetical protein
MFIVRVQLSAVIQPLVREGRQSTEPPRVLSACPLTASREGAKLSEGAKKSMVAAVLRAIAPFASRSFARRSITRTAFEGDVSSPVVTRGMRTLRMR